MERVRKYLEEDNFVRSCGISLVEVNVGRAVARMQVTEQHLNAYRTVQGGAIFTLADYAFAAASNSHGRVAVGVSVSIHFIKSVTAGVLMAEATETSRGHKLATYLVAVKDETGQLVAEFHGMVYRKSEQIAGMEPELT